MEKRAPSSYVAQLEIRKLQPCEDISSYIASIRQLVIKGYPTADKDTRGTIELRHFLKGLPDQQMALAIGMREPKSVEEARSALEMYASLREEVARPPKARAVGHYDEEDQKEGRVLAVKAPSSGDNKPITKAEVKGMIEALGEEIRKSLNPAPTSAGKHTRERPKPHRAKLEEEGSTVQSEN